MSDSLELDATDVALVRLLQEDGRRTAADIGDHLDLSGTAVSRRIARLERGGVILGYTARVDPVALGHAIEAFIELRFVGDTQPVDVHRSLTEIPEVGAIFTTSGTYDALVWVNVTSVAHLTSVISKLRRGRKVVDTRTHIVLASQIAHPWVSRV
jgi:Lrp/AsnC family transcriptional regulator, leucine-responsive regulatory protein